MIEGVVAVNVVDESFWQAVLACVGLCWLIRAEKSAQGVHRFS